MPEINADNAGCQMHLPRGVTHPEHWAGMDSAAGTEARDAAVAEATFEIGNQLAHLLAEIADDRDQLRYKRAASYRHALARFSSRVHAERRAELYGHVLD